MTTSQVQMSLTLTQDTASNLHRLAQVHGVTDSVVVERALALLFEQDDGALHQDYWFSMAAMREDWDVMPEDWMANEVKDAAPSW